MLIPKTLTLIVVVAGVLLILLIGWIVWERRNPKTSDTDIPAADRRLIRLRLLCFAVILVLVGHHAYWVFWADSDESFRRGKILDARNRRLAESGLKGWVLDRSGKLENALIRYRADAGLVSREYPLGLAAVHLTGYSDFVFGSGGVEYAYRSLLTEPVSTYNQLMSPSPVGTDLMLSIDGRLQREAFELLIKTGKPGAVVVLLLPKNEVLAMASTPSFDPATISDESRWRNLSEQAEKSPQLSPLVNRALSTLVTGGPAYYYRPGSTFKIFTAAVAIETGFTKEQFLCKADGFVAAGVTRAIRDFEGEVHGSIGFADAFRHSCNQYFAQLGVKVGRERLSLYARRLGLATSPDDGDIRANNFWNSPSAGKEDFGFIFAPSLSRMNLSSNVTAYDIALQSFGQGYDDATVMQMAQLASSIASSDGSLVAPTFELKSERKAIGPFISKESAARLRELMQSVVTSGTAAGAFSSLRGRISAGGKTGTADRDVIAYGPDGNPIVDRVDQEGRTRYRFERWTDSWFVGFAPAEEPRIAYAVMIENGGQGARAAAPISVRLIEKAAALGYFERSGGRD